MESFVLEKNTTISPGSSEDVRGAASTETTAVGDILLPTSFSQRRLWFLDQMAQSGAGQVVARLHLKGILDATALEQSLVEIARRHDILRTGFTAVDRQPVQIVVPADLMAVPFVIVDHSGLAHMERKSALARLETEERQRSFQLDRAPLWRVTLIRESADDSWLVLTLHRMIHDRASLHVLVNELEAIYRASVLGKLLTLPEPSGQYAEFALQQRKWLQGVTSSEALAYWRDRLSGKLPVLQLPISRSRPAVQTYAGDRVALDLPSSLVEKLSDLSRREGCTLFTTLLAAYQVLLCRHTGQEEVCVGCPVDNRDAAITGVVGPVENVLVLRANLASDPSFRSFLDRARRDVQDADSHRSLPFELLVETVQAERNLSFSPLFQTSFALVSPAPILHLHALAPSRLEYVCGTSSYDLSLIVEDREQTLSLTLDYNVDLFDQMAMERVLDRYRSLLEGIVADPEQPVSTLPLLSTSERQQVLAQWNATDAESAARPIHQWVEAQAAHTPDAVAVEFGERRITYSELNRRANQLAHYLLSMGVGPEARVGISLLRSPEMMVAVLGILKAGGAYVPLDPGYPKERLTFMLEDAQLHALVTQEALLEALPECRALLVCMDVHGPLIDRQSEQNPPEMPVSDRLVYVTYTSGSTGRPKGILMTQRPLLNLLAWMLRTTRLPEGARTLQFASLSFDVSFQDIFSTWCSGGTLVLITEAQRQDIGGLWRILLDRDIQRLFLPAVALQQLAEGFRPQEHGRAALRKVISGSEQLMITQAITRMFTHLPDCRLHNEYGPSETHVVTEAALLASPHEWPIRPGIGRPIANTQIYVLDRKGQPAPVGVPGEVHIGGAGLARGYLNLAGVTAEKFVPDPFSDRAGLRLYRTGDLGRWLEDGSLEFLGRIDYQVKIRGYRIEPGEIEAVLERHPGVREASVQAWEYGPFDKRLIAYLGVDSPQGMTVSGLRAFLSEKLPEYMVPSAFVLLERLPLNTNGKVDRSALPAPDSMRPDLDAAYVEPTTDIEQEITRIWQKALGRDRIGTDDNFFDLGGHSMLIVQVQSQLKQALGVEIAIVDLFRCSTISSLASHLSRETDAHDSSSKIQDRANRQREALARQRQQRAHARAPR